jgi:hypothetical protein
MKITFIIADTWSPVQTMIHTNVTTATPKRTVTIDLSNYETIMSRINLKKVGTTKGRDVREEVLEVFVEKED